jgi:CheY-like chemotaxis protein
MPHKILIVDDNENHRLIIRDILGIHGYEVSVATDGTEGVALAMELKPDLILMDIQMSGMDGIIANRVLKHATETGGIKIIAVTSFTMPGTEEKFISVGFDGYISKPINTRELPDLVKQWLGSGKKGADGELDSAA